MRAEGGWRRTGSAINDGDQWRKVKVTCPTDYCSDGDKSPEGLRQRVRIAEETANAVRSVLRSCFKEGPAAAARAQAAYKSWVHGVVEVGGSEPSPPDARRWREFQDRWGDFVWQNITREFANFSSLEGIDFKPALRRSRARGRSM